MHFKYSRNGEPFRFIIQHSDGTLPTVKTDNCQREIHCVGCQIEYRLFRVTGPMVISIIQNYFLDTN